MAFRGPKVMPKAFVWYKLNTMPDSKPHDDETTYLPTDRVACLDR